MQTATNPATAASHTATAPRPAHATAVHLGLALLRLKLSELLSSGVFTATERATATANVYATADAAQLVLWRKNVSRVRAEREAAAQPADALADVPGSEEIEAEAAAANLTVEQLADLSSNARALAPTVNPHLARAYGNAVAARAHRGRTADYAAELAYAVRGEAFLLETGMTYSELARL